jgi:hypothetical protein
MADDLHILLRLKDGCAAAATAAVLDSRARAIEPGDRGAGRPRRVEEEARQQGAAGGRRAFAAG